MEATEKKPFDCNIRFDDGKQDFPVNGGYTIRFNPTDTEFAKQIMAAIERMGKIQTRYSEMGEKAIDTDLPEVDYEKAVMDGDAAELKKSEQVSAMVRERLSEFDGLNTELAKEIDGLFGEGTAAGIFRETALTAFAGGLPVWVNFLTAVLEQFEGAAREMAENEEDNLRALTAKYTQKYERNRQVYRSHKKKRRH